MSKNQIARCREMMRFYGIVLAMALGPVAGRAQTKQISEPIFGIPYNPRIVHFEKGPPLIEENCKDMRQKNDLIVYASIRDRDTQYFIVQELLGEFGVAIAIDQKRCAEVDLDRFLYDGADAFAEQGIHVTKDDNRRIQEEFAHDIVKEYSRAFGGSDKFLKALGARADCLPNSILRKEIEMLNKTKESKKAAR